MANLQKQYDSILVGYTLGSLYWAKKLRSQGKKFCIVDNPQTSQFPVKNLQKLNQDVYTRVPFLSSAQGQSLPLPLQDILAEGNELEAPPLTFNQGDFKSFLGFGDLKVDALEELTRLSSPKNLFVKNNPEKLWQELLPAEDEVFLDQQLTDIEADENGILSLSFNGKNQVQAQEYIFFNHFPRLLVKMAHFSKPLASKMKKIKWWASVNVVLAHKEAPEKVDWESYYLLMGSKELPCFGRFDSLAEDLCISRWQCFFPNELIMDSETSGAAVKEIKKQVKRAFQGEFQEALIQAEESSTADLSSIPLNDGKLADFNNLRVCSPLFLAQRGWFYELVMAERQLSEISPAPIEPEPPQDLSVF